MRDDQLRRLLIDGNPWWRAGPARGPTAWARHHRLLNQRDAHDVGYRTRVLDDVAAAPVDDALVLFVGPRRVGKSVALLDLVVSLSRREDVDPRAIVHLPCDGLRARDLRRAFTLGRALTGPVDEGTPRRRIWVIDEIGSVPDWTAVLEAARDQIPVGDDTVVMASSSGSSGPAVIGNLLAGRARILRSASRPARLRSRVVPATRRRGAGGARPPGDVVPVGPVARLAPSSRQQQRADVRFAPADRGRRGPRARRCDRRR